MARVEIHLPPKLAEVGGCGARPRARGLGAGDPWAGAPAKDTKLLSRLEGGGRTASQGRRPGLHPHQSPPQSWRPLPGAPHSVSNKCGNVTEEPAPLLSLPHPSWASRDTSQLLCTP